MHTDRAGVAWCAPPSGDGGMYYPLLAPKPGKDVVGIILSECIAFVWTYYVPANGAGEKGHSLPCTCTEQPCEGAKMKRDHRQKGYLACWDRAKGRLFIAEVTKEAYLRCPAFELFAGALRGKTLRLCRRGEAANARVQAVVTAPQGQPFELPPAFNVRSALERIWHPPQGPLREAVQSDGELKDGKEGWNTEGRYGG